MCSHAKEIDTCPLCERQTFFTKRQVAFLEDLLINGGCMTALQKEKSSTNPDMCRHCAENIFSMVEKIRELRE